MHATKEDTPPSDTAITNPAALEDEPEKGMREKGEEGEMEEKALLTESSKDTHL